MTIALGNGDRPLVAVVCTVPLLSEALAASLDGIADVRAFPGDLDDADGLLRSLAPDAVVVDSLEQAAAAEPFARETRTPLVGVDLRAQHLRVLRGGAWELLADGDASPEAIRNVLVGDMYRRQPA